MSDLILFWHRRDLRISDNLGLATAAAQTSKVVGLFCLDPGILDGDDIAPARVTYMIGCLSQLQESYQQLGSQLLIIQGRTANGNSSTSSSTFSHSSLLEFGCRTLCQETRSLC